MYKCVNMDYKKKLSKGSLGIAINVGLMVFFFISDDRQIEFFFICYIDFVTNIISLSNIVEHLLLVFV